MNVPASVQFTTAPSVARHVPERSCVACRKKRPQGEFVRLIHAGAGWTLAGKHKAGQLLSGRGAYVCADTPGCWAEKRLRRAFGAQAASLSLLLQTQSHPQAQELHPANL
ncbi:YlxR family protein [Deinococcus psychrotolerans]|uniref:YlxR family protein n=1 Tax=Deinococcus psychrotolerans TaxID=2489213 RepID=UPI001F14E9B2|nr:DUF448 domain-containing protein [Deinococcus psychrotolerans]